MTLGFDPTRFRDRAASLLPGLLAAARTGLSPAGDDALMLDQLIIRPPPTLGARTIWAKQMLVGLIASHRSKVKLTGG